jgi:hypothetical protein
MSAYQAPVPGQQGGRGDDALVPQWAGQGSDQGRQDCPVRPGQPRPAGLASQDGNLVAEHQQFGGHRGFTPRELWQPAEHLNRAEVQQPNKHDAILREATKGQLTPCAIGIGAAPG